MLTPYKILQLKQKQKKKINSESQKQRSFSVRYAKNGDHTSQCFIQKDTFVNHKTAQTPNMSHHQSEKLQKKGTIADKKYEIVFRQSIRKANAERIKLYHPKDIKKIQKQKKITANSEQQRTSIHSINFHQQSPKKSYRIESNKKRIQQDQENEFESLSVGKYRILLRRSPQQIDQNQFAPEISVQKCKINFHQNENHQKMEKTIRSLYLHNKKMKHTYRKCSVESVFTQKDHMERSQPQSKTINFNWLDNEQFSVQQTKINLNSKILTNIDSKIEPKIISKHDNESRYQIDGETHQTIDCKNVANFIKTKRKRRLPISIMQKEKKNKDFDEFKRTVTDEFSNYSRRRSVTKTMEDRYFSPNKKSRKSSKVKFNSIEENISGWQLSPCQIINQQNPLKSPLY